jgi:hypothetical protein
MCAHAPPLKPPQKVATLDTLLAGLLAPQQPACRPSALTAGHVRLELLEVLGVAQLLEQVPRQLHAHLLAVRVDLVHGGAQARLVLSLQHHIHHLELRAAVGLRHDAARLRVDVGEAAACRFVKGGGWGRGAGQQTVGEAAPRASPQQLCRAQAGTGSAAKCWLSGLWLALGLAGWAPRRPGLMRCTGGGPSCYALPAVCTIGLPARAVFLPLQGLSSQLCGGALAQPQNIWPAWRLCAPRDHRCPAWLHS